MTEKKKRRTPVQKFHFDTTFTEKMKNQMIDFLKKGNGVLNHTGTRVIIYRTLEKMGFKIQSRYLRAIFIDACNELGMITQVAGQKHIKANSRPTDHDSMKLGPHAQELGWELVQQPAVYKIVCEGNGNYYIGASTRPDLRRAVHKFWLRQPWRYGISNVFFGNKRLWKDVQKYGWESFHMDIIYSMPGATLHELEPFEQQAINEADHRKLYNSQVDKHVQQANYTKFMHLDAELRRLVKEMDIEAKRVVLTKKIEKEREKLKVIRATKWPKHDKCVRVAKQNKIISAIIKERASLPRQKIETKRTIQAHLKALHKRYAESEIPLY